MTGKKIEIVIALDGEKSLAVCAKYKKRICIAESGNEKSDC